MEERHTLLRVLRSQPHLRDTAILTRRPIHVIPRNARFDALRNARIRLHLCPLDHIRDPRRAYVIQLGEDLRQDS